jgi:microsomal dipeptidase-like Zn-dependent dipeptidase
VIADLHAHYAMHLMPPGAESALRPMTSREWRSRWRARLLGAISRLANYQGPGGGPSVTIDLMRRGRVGVALSALYWPFAEIDLRKRYGAPPEDAYFRDVLAQLELVEDDIREHEADLARVVTTPAELADAVGEGKLALVHSVEGGFHLGETEATVRENVAELARRGVAYVTLAHLFWRRVATNSVALPLPEWLYGVVFRQPRGEGLSELGAAALDAMVEHGVMVDVAHMSQASLDDTFRLLDERDPEHRVPPIASHGACRFGRRGYNLSDETVRRIGERGGVIGLSASERHLTNGLRRDGTRTWQDTVEVICAHVERIRDLTGGGYDHVAIGSDMDGFIKPTVHGLEHMGRMAGLEDALRERYGEEDAGSICSGNALRLLERHWGGGVARA